MAARKAAKASKYEVVEAPASNAGRPRLRIAELEEFASDWVNGDVPVLPAGKGIKVPAPGNNEGNERSDIALVRHHLKVTLAEHGIDKDAYSTFTVNGAVMVRRIF